MMDSKTNYNNMQLQFDYEGSLIERVYLEIKYQLFKIVTLLLKFDKQSLTLAIITRIIQYFQLNAILFNRQIWKVWKNEIISQPLQQFFQYFLITPYFGQNDFIKFVIITYVCISIIIFATMIFCLVGYSMNRTNQSFAWGITLLKLLLDLFLTILYLPFIDVFISMIACHYEGSTLQHSIFNEKCWSNTHIVHGIVSIFALIYFFILTIFLSMIYYEVNFVPNKLNSQKQSKSLTILLLYEFIMVICISYMNDSLYQYLHIIIMLGGSFVVFWKQHVEKPYNNYFIQLSYSMLSSFHLWGTSMLCFAKYLEGTLFFGVIYAWIGGIPFIIITLIRPQTDNYDILMTNLAQCQSSEKIYNKTNYLQKLQYESLNDQTAGLVIEGYLDLHKNTCVREDCHLKLKNLPNYRGKKVILGNQNLSERDLDIQIVLYQIFLNQTKKFANCLKLRISFALYMYEKMKQKQNALTELQALEQLYPKFEEEFIIFRFKKIIEDEMSHTESNGNFDIGNELQFQNNFQLFQSIIERVCILHMDFWSLLQEDLPDLGKLNEIGQKINNQVSTIDEIWKKMQKLSTNLPKALRIYGKFLIEVLQDKDLGEKMLEKSRTIQQLQNLNREKQILQFMNSEEISYESLPTIIMSTAVDKFSQITNLNKSCCNLLAYNKSEILNKKLSSIMPTLYQKIHDKLVEHYVQNNQSNAAINDKLIYVKQKNGYIQPAYIMIRTLQSYDDNCQIIGQFKLIKYYKPLCYLIINHDFIIDSISSSCQLLLGIDSKLISHNKLTINDIFSSFTDQLNIYQTKQGGQIKLINQVFQSKAFSQLNTPTGTEKTQAVFQCNVNQINDFDGNLVGYAVKLESLINDKQSTIHVNSLYLDKKSEQGHQSQLQFKLNKDTMTYITEIGQEQNSQRIDQSILWDQQSQSLIGTSNVGNDAFKGNTERSDDNIQSTTQKFCDGIRIVRLIDNKIQDIDDKEEVLSDEDDPDRQSVFQKIDNDIAENGQQENINAFKSRTILQQYVNNQKVPDIITKLSWTMNIQLIGIVTLSFVAFFLTTSQYFSIEDQLNLVQYVGIRNAEFFNIPLVLQNLEMTLLNINSFNQEDELNNFLQDQKEFLNDTINTISDLNKIILLSNSFTNDELNQINTQDIIKVRISNDTYQYYDLVQTMEQILSKSIIVRDKKLSQMNTKDDDFSFIMYNMFGDFLLKLQNATQQYSQGLAQKTDANKQELLSILGASAGILGASLIIIILFLLIMAKKQQDILVLFLDIPDKTIKYLYSKSENFLSNIQIGEEEEIISDIEDVEKEEQEELNRTLKQRRKKKKIKNSNKELRNLIIVSIVLAMLFQSYFIICYFLSGTTLANLNQMTQEINVTSFAEGFYKVAESAQRLIFLNREIPITGVDSYMLSQVIISSLYEIDASFHQLHSQNVDITNSLYTTAFQDIFMLQPCQIFVDEMETGTEDECLAVASGALNQGMAVGMARYIENIRYLQTIYDQFYGNPLANFTAIVRGNIEFINITNNADNVTNYIYNINHYTQAKELRLISRKYLKATYRYLIFKMIDSINQDLNTSETQLLALFVVFETLLFILYFLIWLPLIFKLTRDMLKTRSMVLMIPLKVIIRIRSIKIFIKEVILQKPQEK